MRFCLPSALLDREAKESARSNTAQQSTKKGRAAIARHGVAVDLLTGLMHACIGLAFRLEMA